MQNFLKIAGGIILLILAFKVLAFIFHLLHGILAIAGIIIFVGTLLHILFNEELSVGAKVIWAAIVLFTNIIGTILYFLFGRRSAISL